MPIDSRNRLPHGTSRRLSLETKQAGTYREMHTLVVDDARLVASSFFKALASCRLLIHPSC
jgi:hypothetical protein